MADKINKKYVMEAVSEPIENLGLTLLDVEIKNSGGKTTLSLIVDKKGGVTVEDCESVSKIADPILDETDGVAGKYDFFNVSSAGIDRPFKTTNDFETHIGEKIEVKLFSAVDGNKFYSKTLIEASEEYIVLDGNIKILRNNIQKANIAIEF